MRRQSKKTAARERACRKFREDLVAETGVCEVCHHDPDRVNTGQVRRALAVHEIASGSCRQDALDQRYAVLVVCWRCNQDIHSWAKARQLAILKASRPADYDLEAFNELRRGLPRVSEEDVEKWLDQIE